MIVPVSRSTQEATIHREPFLFFNGFKEVNPMVFTHWIFDLKRNG